eukprot:EG_transcript_31201
MGSGDLWGKVGIGGAKPWASDAREANYWNATTIGKCTKIMEAQSLEAGSWGRAPPGLLSWKGEGGGQDRARSSAAPMRQRWTAAASSAADASAGEQHVWRGHQLSRRSSADEVTGVPR